MLHHVHTYDTTCSHPCLHLFYTMVTPMFTPMLHHDHTYVYTYVTPSSHLCYTMFTPMLHHVHTYVTPCSYICVELPRTGIYPISCLKTRDTEQLLEKNVDTESS